MGCICSSQKNNLPHGDNQFKQLIGLKLQERQVQFEKCIVIKVYDGDTITVAFYDNGCPYKCRVRLAGIDTPELKGANVSNDEKFCAKYVRQKLEDAILHKQLVAQCEQRLDKYGRVLAVLYLNDVWESKNHAIKSVNQWLIDKEYAQPYDGGAKKPFNRAAFLKNDILHLSMNTT